MGTMTETAASKKNDSLLEINGTSGRLRENGTDKGRIQLIHNVNKTNKQLQHLYRYKLTTKNVAIPSGKLYMWAEYCAIDLGITNNILSSSF